MNEFDAMDDAEVPDQWDEIVERSALAGRVEAEGGRSRRGLAGGAIAAAVLVVTLVAGLVALDRSGDEETVTLDTGPASETTDPEATDPEAIDPEVAEADDAEPHLVCPTGELAAGSIPDDAGLGGIPVWGTEVIGDRTTWGWREIPLEVQLIVPGIQTVSLPATIETEEIDRDRGDVAGTISHAVSHDDGRESVNVSIPTGLDGPCAWSTVAVAGGTEAERTALAMHLAQELDWATSLRKREQ